MNERKPFLTAEWRHLVMLNYPVDRAVLESLLPAGTMLDTYKGVAYVSLVAFRFLHTRLLGVTIPFHQDFEEVNLRFYVRRFAEGDWRRGVVFIKEFVPKAAVALVARRIYNENYLAVPMRHRVESVHDGASLRLQYEWQHGGRWHSVRAQTSGAASLPPPASLEEFITEHYWGYARQADGTCVEYQVGHPRWQVWRTSAAALDCDAAALYGDDFSLALAASPASALVAEGSAVTVYQGNRIP